MTLTKHANSERMDRACVLVGDGHVNSWPLARMLAGSKHASATIITHADVENSVSSQVRSCLAHSTMIRISMEIQSQMP